MDGSKTNQVCRVKKLAGLIWATYCSEGITCWWFFFFFFLAAGFSTIRQTKRHSLLFFLSPIWSLSSGCFRAERNCGLCECFFFVERRRNGLSRSHPHPKKKNRTQRRRKKGGGRKAKWQADRHQQLSPFSKNGSKVTSLFLSGAFPEK